MADGTSWVIVALGFFVLPIVAVPKVSRVLHRAAERANEWVMAREASRSVMDPEQEKLWLWSKRRQLCTALDRIERLLRTDAWMSGTRQLGNRLAYEQLLAELSHIPDVFPSTIEPVGNPSWSPAAVVRRGPGRRRTDTWDDRDFAVGWSVTDPSAMVSGASQSGAVEVIEIGWRQR